MRAGSSTLWDPPHLPAFSFPGKSKEAEIKRINKELANIRSKFKGRLGARLLGLREERAGGWNTQDL